MNPNSIVKKVFASSVKAFAGSGNCDPLRSGYVCRPLQVILSMHRSDVVKIYYFLVTRAQKGKKGKKEDEIYGILRIILFQPPVLVGEFDKEVLLLSRS